MRCRICGYETGIVARYGSKGQGEKHPVCRKCMEKDRKKWHVSAIFKLNERERQNWKKQQFAVHYGRQGEISNDPVR